MYDGFDPLSVCLYMTKPTKRMYDIQFMLYTKLINGSQCKGLELIRPNTIVSAPKRHAHPNLPPLPLPPPPSPSTPSTPSNATSQVSAEP